MANRPPNESVVAHPRPRQKPQPAQPRRPHLKPVNRVVQRESGVGLRRRREVWTFVDFSDYLRWRSVSTLLSPMICMISTRSFLLCFY